MDWSTEEALAALAIANVQKPHNVTDFEAAEVIVYAKELLFYSQAKEWAENPPKGTPVTWQQACKVVVEIVDLGYNAQHKMWWYMADWDKARLLKSTLLLMDLGDMIRQMRQNSLMVVAGSFDVFIELVCGRDWRTQFKKLAALSKTMGKA